MDTTEQCVRCGREISIDASEFTDGEATADGHYVCGNCLTGAERQAADDDTMAMAHKVRENRVRRMAGRQGLRLEKSRRRDTFATDWSTYRLVDASTNGVVSYGDSSLYGLTLDDIERQLTS